MTIHFDEMQKITDDAWDRIRQALSNTAKELKDMSDPRKHRCEIIIRPAVFGFGDTSYESDTHFEALIHFNGQTIITAPAPIVDTMKQVAETMGWETHYVDPFGLCDERIEVWCA